MEEMKDFLENTVATGKIEVKYPCPAMYKTIHPLIWKFREGLQHSLFDCGGNFCLKIQENLYRCEFTDKEVVDTNRLRDTIKNNTLNFETVGCMVSGQVTITALDTGKRLTITICDNAINERLIEDVGEKIIKFWQILNVSSTETPKTGTPTWDCCFAIKGNGKDNHKKVERIYEKTQFLGSDIVCASDSRKIVRVVDGKTNICQRCHYSEIHDFLCDVEEFYEDMNESGLQIESGTAILYLDGIPSYRYEFDDNGDYEEYPIDSGTDNHNSNKLIRTIR